MKRFFNKELFELLLAFLLITFLFVFMSFFAENYKIQIEEIVKEDKILGMFIYVFTSRFAVIISPVSAMPLIPLASHLWGWFTAGCLSILGWLLGAQIAFFLARRFGKPLVQKLIPIEKLHALERQIPEKHLFWSVVFLRIFVSVDLLSYALGLFSNMKNSSYLLATFLGIIPFAFIFAYTGTLSVYFQLGILLVGFIVTLIWYIIKKNNQQ